MHPFEANKYENIWLAPEDTLGQRELTFLDARQPYTAVNPQTGEMVDFFENILNATIEICLEFGLTPFDIYAIGIAAKRSIVARSLPFAKDLLPLSLSACISDSELYSFQACAAHGSIQLSTRFQLELESDKKGLSGAARSKIKGFYEPQEIQKFRKEKVKFLKSKIGKQFSNDERFFFDFVRYGSLQSGRHKDQLQIYASYSLDWELYFTGDNNCRT